MAILDEARASAAGRSPAVRANPIGYLIEQAGGRASTGHGPILDVVPESLHQRVSFVFGARSEVERIEHYHRDHNEFELDVPLFAARGLFTQRI